jgi:DNA-binding MarR family transcriptional regulator
MAAPIPLARYTSRIYRYGQRFLDRRLVPLGLGSGQVGFLVLLYQGDGVSQVELAQELGFDRATAAQALARLEAAGYITRTVDDCDRRIKRVWLTGHARAMQAAFTTAVEEWSALLTRGLGEREQQQARALLEQLAANAEEAVRVGCERD